MDSGTVAAYNKIRFIVNNVSLAQPDKPFKIKINEKGLDTIRLEGFSIYQSETIITKLRANETYEIHFNACSNYEIIPKTKREEGELVRVVSIHKDSTKMFLNSAYCDVDPRQIWEKDTTDYFHKASSGYCPYAVNSFQMCVKDFDELYKDKFNPSDCNGIILYFSGLEMFTLVYDYKTKALTARFDGYYDKKLKLNVAPYHD
jgi:hypothetical protein